MNHGLDSLLNGGFTSSTFNISISDGGIDCLGTLYANTGIKRFEVSILTANESVCRLICHTTTFKRDYFPITCVLCLKSFGG